jgi:hypothetical protein
VSTFEAAADAVVSGDAATLERLLRDATFGDKDVRLGRSASTPARRRSRRSRSSQAPT